MISGRDNIDARAITLGQHICDTGATLRATAALFGISKSTVHKDVSVRLRDICPALWEQVKDILEGNKAERHIRGGLATKEKYERLHKASGAS